MSLLGVIARFATPGTAANGEYTVTRSAVGSYATGDYVRAAPATFPITATVQPLDGRTVVVLPEGVRTEDVRQLWTSTALRALDTQVDADVIELPAEQGPELFRVFRVEGPWTLGGRTHYRVLVARGAKA